MYYKQKKWASILLSGVLFVPQMVSSQIVTTIKPLAFITAAIAEGVIDTEVLLPDGASPHSYALRPSDMQKLQKAALIVWIGEEMERFLEKPLKKASSVEQINLSQIPAIREIIINTTHDHSDHEHDHSPHDHSNHEHRHPKHAHNENKNLSKEPVKNKDLHIWLSPDIAKEIALVVRDKLLQKYPQKADTVNHNYTYFMQQMQENDKYLKEKLAPVKNRGFYVFHDAYSYYESYFGLTNKVGKFTVNPEVAPGAKKLHQIQQQLLQQDVQCVFSEPQFRTAVVDTIIRNTNVKHGRLDPLGMRVAVSKESYVQFLTQLSDQFLSCLSNGDK